MGEKRNGPSVGVTCVDEKQVGLDPECLHSATSCDRGEARGEKEGKSGGRGRRLAIRPMDAIQLVRRCRMVEFEDARARGRNGRDENNEGAAKVGGCWWVREKREKGGKGRGGRCGRRWRWLRFFGLAQFHYLQLAKGKPGPGQTPRVKQQKSNMEKKAN